MAVLYPYLGYNELCYKWTALYIVMWWTLFYVALIFVILYGI